MKMKKSVIIKITVIILLLILIINGVYKIIYFNDFQNKTRGISEIEKQTVLEVLNQTVKIEEYKIEFGRVFSTNKQEIILVKLTKENITEDYLIDLKSGELLK